MRAIVVFVVVPLLFSCGQSIDRVPYPEIDTAAIQRHVDVFRQAEETDVSDGPGGEAIAMTYVEDVFLEIGLKVSKKTFDLRQIYSEPGPLTIHGPEASNTLEITEASHAPTSSTAMSDVRVTDEPTAVIERLQGSRTLAVGDDFVAWARQSNPTSVSDQQFVFAGYGVVAPEYSWNDYEGVDVAGKIVIVVMGQPHVGTRSLLGPGSQEYYGGHVYKFDEGERQGAAGVLIVHDPTVAGFGWSEFSSSRLDAFLELPSLGDQTDLAVEGWLRRESAEGLFLDAGLVLDDEQRLANESKFEPVFLPLTASIDVKNSATTKSSTIVLAELEGSPSEGERAEHILVASHWNDLPAGSLLGTHLTDSIAQDHSPGAAVILEVARVLAREPGQRRSVLFIVATAESEGVLGMRHYALTPSLPLESARAALYYTGFEEASPPGLVSVVDYSFYALKDLFRIEAADQGRVVTSESNTEELRYYDYTQASFTDSRIPNIFFTSILHGDELRIHGAAVPEFDSVVENLDARLIFNVVMHLTSTPNLPVWRPGVPLERPVRPTPEH